MSRPTSIESPPRGSGSPACWEEIAVAGPSCVSDDAARPLPSSPTRPRAGSRSRPGRSSSRCLSYEAIWPSTGPDAFGHMPAVQEGFVSDITTPPNRSRAGSGVPETPTTTSPPPPSRQATALSPLNPSPSTRAKGSLGRARSHTVSVTMPTPPAIRVTPTRSNTMGAEPGAPGSGSRPRSNSAAQAGGRPRSSSLSSSRDSHRESVSAVSYTIPEAHDTSIADHEGRLNDEMVGLLDVVDQEISMVNNLQNVTNAIMVPNIPMLWSRRPNMTLQPDHTTLAYDPLPEPAATDGELPAPVTAKTGRSRASTLTSWIPGVRRESQPQQPHQQLAASQPPLGRVESHHSSASVPGDLQLHEVVYKKFDDELSEDADDVSEENEFDKHVKKVLLTQDRKDKLRRALKGLWAFLKTPMGVITAIYGIAVVFWGAAIVFFLAHWIPVKDENQNDIWIEISSQVVNGLFTVTGVGLIPWRVIDTYRMSIIHTLKMRVRRRRKERGLPPIEDEDDMPDPATIPGYEQVLTDKEEHQLEYQQKKFSESQTWYRPHATATHRAFPITLALWNTILMDGNSFFQCILCGCMWGMNRHKRPAWTTGTLIPCSFLCGIGAAVLIWQGGVRTKKTKTVEDKLRKVLAIDEKVPETVKRPRRATVDGAAPDLSSVAPSASLKPSMVATMSPRHATISALPLMPLVGTTTLRKDIHPDYLASVEETAEETGGFTTLRPATSDSSTFKDKDLELEMRASDSSGNSNDLEAGVAVLPARRPSV